MKLIELLSTAFVISIVPLQLKLWTGHRGVHPQRMLSITGPFTALRCYKGGMEGMGKMESVILVDLKDRGERGGHRDQLGIGESKE